MRASHPTKRVGKYKRITTIYIYNVGAKPPRPLLTVYTCCSSNHMIDVKRYIAVVVVPRILRAFLLAISPRPHHRSYQNPRQRPSAYHPLDETTRRRDGGGPPTRRTIRSLLKNHRVRVVARQIQTTVRLVAGNKLYTAINGKLHCIHAKAYHR